MSKKLTTEEFIEKSKKSLTMSEDRRPITDSEIIGLFEFYLRK